jgi:predicted dehydrogenase
MMRFGLIGCGRHGERYLRHLAAGDVRGAGCTALWRRDRDAARALARRYEVRAAESLEEMLDADDVDALVVLTPPGGHVEQIRAVLASGRPVLVEKPVTGNFATAHELLRSLPADAPVMVAHTLRFAPSLQIAHQELPRIGTIHRVRAAIRLEPNDLLWQRDPAIAGGGSVVLTGVHLFDVLRWFTRRTPDAVQCRLARLQGHPLENLFDACFEHLEPPVLMATEVSKFSQSRSVQIELVGEEGQLDVDVMLGTVRWKRGGAVQELARPGGVPTIPPALAAFVAWQRGEIECPVSLLDGVETLRMAEAAYRSHDRGRRVSLSELPLGVAGSGAADVSRPPEES